MGSIEAIQVCFRKCASFSGRASRPEFWYFILFLFVGSLICTILNKLVIGPEILQKIGLPSEGNSIADPNPTVLRKYNGGMLSNIFFLATVVPWFAVTWRRLHNSNKAGWRALLPIPMFLVTLGMMNFFSELRPIDISNWPPSMTANLTETPMMRFPTNAAMYFGGFPLIFVSIVLVIFWLTRPSQSGPNHCGPNPNEVPT